MKELLLDKAIRTVQRFMRTYGYKCTVIMPDVIVKVPFDQKGETA